MSTVATEPEPQAVRQMPATPEWLRAQPSAKDRVKPIGVDRDNKVIRGVVLVQEGVFKSGRGEFEAKDVREAFKLAKAAPGGLRSRFSHPDESDDGVGKHLGRHQNIKMDKMKVATPDGKGKEIAIVRGDLHFAPSASDTPRDGDLAKYVMDRVDEDSDAISTSLVLHAKQEMRRDKTGDLLLDEETGEPLPPLWHPTELHASDVVGEGDAVDGILGTTLSLSSLPNGIAWQAGEMLSKLFAGQPREVVEARCAAYVTKYLDRQFGETTGDWVDHDEQLHQCREAVRDLSRSDDGSDTVIIETALMEEVVNKLGSVLVGPAELRAKCEQLKSDLAAAYELFEETGSVGLTQLAWRSATELCSESPVEQGPETPEDVLSIRVRVSQALVRAGGEVLAGHVSRTVLDACEKHKPIVDGPENTGFPVYVQPDKGLVGVVDARTALTDQSDNPNTRIARSLRQHKRREEMEG